MHEARLHQRIDLIEDLDAFVWEADPFTLQFTYVGKGAERLLGYSLEDWLARPTFWFDLLHPDDRRNAVAHCRAAVDRGEDHDFEYRVIASDGRILWIRDIVKVIGGEGGNPTLLRGLMLDVTSQKTAQTRLERQRRYQQTLVEQVGEIIIVVDADGVIRYQSPSIERVLGYRTEERVGHSVFEHLHPDDLPRVRSVFDSGMRSDNRVQPTQLRCRHADGTWRVLEAVGHRFFDDDDEPPVAVINCRDVTDRRRLEELVRHAQKMEAVGRLTANLTHDFNNVLQAVLGNAELARSSEHASGVDSQLCEIHKAAQVGMTLTRRLLTFTRRSTGHPVRIDANTTIANLSGIIHRLVGEKIRVDFDLHATRPWVRLGSGMLEQVLMNLAANARDAMSGEGHLRITTSTPFDNANQSVAAERLRPVLVIEVSDTGAGLTDEVRSHLFEPYFTTKEEGKGTGLGLPIIHNIVREGGGHIEVFSTPGTGTTFAICLPIIDEEEEVESSRKDVAAKR
jgi:PAS domain S-box-containing protein